MVTHKEYHVFLKLAKEEYFEIVSLVKKSVVLKILGEKN